MWDMLKMGELERLELNMLAMYCLRVAEFAAANSLQAEQASKLKTEWGLLIFQPVRRYPGWIRSKTSRSMARS